MFTVLGRPIKILKTVVFGRPRPPVSYENLKFAVLRRPRPSSIPGPGSPRTAGTRTVPSCGRLFPRMTLVDISIFGFYFRNFSIRTKNDSDLWWSQMTRNYQSAWTAVKEFQVDLDNLFDNYIIENKLHVTAFYYNTNMQIIEKLVKWFNLYLFEIKYTVVRQRSSCSRLAHFMKILKIFKIQKFSDAY